MKKFLLCLGVLFLSGCNAINLGPQTAYNTTILRNGTAATVVGSDKTEFITDSKGNAQIVDSNTHKIIVEGVYTEGSIKGMMILDDPTLQYYKKLQQLYSVDYLKRLGNGDFVSPSVVTPPVVPASK